MRTAWLLARTAWLALGLTMGCGAAGQSQVPVRGKVFYRGVPLTAGLIVFAPDATRGTNGPLARSEVQPDGSYQLHTEGAAGASPGWYRITIMALEPSTAAPGAPPSVPRSLLPDKYRDPELSGLVRQVKTGQENLLDFHLE
jgi:hypothetical protein